MNNPASYPETADIETSSPAYARRFAGGAGRWMLAVQERLAMELIDARSPTTVIDVGGGHGQLAIPLCRKGADVTIVGSSDACREPVEGIISDPGCAFVTGNVIDLPFADRSFGMAISFRLLTHCRQWPRLVAELCRVATDSVVVDYPTIQSVNRISGGLFGAKKKLEGDTRPFALFRHREIDEEFARQGFAVTARRKQFLLPMVVHRTLRCRPLSAAAEGLCRAIGLTRLWGSPVIIRADRREAANERA